MFITGSTGFLGKVLVEKLLRSCAGIERVYILIRPKYGRDVKQRVQQLSNSKVFDRLKAEHPDALDKLIGVSGDVTLPELGLSTADAKTLADEVSVVFHSAATVKFDEELKTAIEMNVMGTRRLLDLCRRMTKLVAFVHVSTAFCNCNEKDLEETVVPLSPSPTQILDALQWMSDGLIQAVAPELLKGRPNTYTYTKALAENVLNDECGDLPVAIVRPSIVVASWKEPYPGWVDSVNGTTGIILGCMKGVLRSMVCNSEMVADDIPVDICINLMISVAWHMATFKPNGISVYNCTSGDINHHTWGQLRKECLLNLRRVPVNNALWYPSMTFHTCKFYQELSSTLLHHCPAYFLDIIARLTGNKPIMVNTQLKIDKVLGALEYFTTHEWNFRTGNMWIVWDALSEEDQQVFDFDLRKLHWPAYFEKYCLGIKLYILKEDLSNISSARSHLRRMYFIRQMSYLLCILVAWRTLRSCHGILSALLRHRTSHLR